MELSELGMDPRENIFEHFFVHSRHVEVGVELLLDQSDKQQLSGDFQLHISERASELRQRGDNLDEGLHEVGHQRTEGWSLPLQAA